MARQLIGLLFLSLAGFGCRTRPEDSRSLEAAAAPADAKTDDAYASEVEAAAKQADALGATCSDADCVLDGRALPSATAPAAVAQAQAGAQIQGLMQAPTAPSDGADAADISTILDDAFVAKLNAFDCTKNVGEPPRPYFPGVQAVDQPLLANIAGDQGTADLYTRYAALGVKSGTSAVHNWSLLYYYNRPSLNKKLNPRTVKAGSSTFSSYYRENFAPLRVAVRQADGKVARWGDELETRMLGIWAKTAGDGFRKRAPAFDWPNAALETHDFDDFIADVASRPAWRTFMNHAAFEVGAAFKCGIPVYAHSGGGAAVAFVLRLLGERPGLNLPDWQPGHRFVVIGLEAVLTEQIPALLNAMPAYAGRLVVQNYVVFGGDANPLAGSSTWVLIDQALRSTNGTPLVTAGVPFANPPGWNGDGAGHAGLGLYVLWKGGLPTVAFPAP